jgi:broad-specificity NMP kinase
MAEYNVVEVRATGRTPEAVTEEIQKILNERQAEQWDLTNVQPIIYNSSTTGYLILFFRRG